jgi:hypothetical protein
MIIPEILKQLAKNHDWHLFNTTHSHCEERYDIRLPDQSIYHRHPGDVFCEVSIKKGNAIIIEVPSRTETNISLADPNGIHKIRRAVAIAFNQHLKT